MKNNVIETRVKQEFRYPIEFAGEDIQTWCPHMLDRLSTEEVCALHRGNYQRINEILEDSGLDVDAYSQFAKSEMEKHGFEVFHTEVFRDGEEMVVICHAILYQNAIPSMMMPSYN